MRRVITVDKVGVCFRYYDADNKELGQVNYNMREGYFVLFSWPSSFSALQKIAEYIRLLSFAQKIIKSEICN